MFEFLKTAKEQDLTPQILDPVLLEKKKQQLIKLIHKATLDGIITPIEDAEITELAIQVGINKVNLKKMINAEFVPQLKTQIELFAKDGKIDKNEMIAIQKRARDIDLSNDELAMIIAEALSHHKEEVRKKFTLALSAIGFGIIAVGTVFGKALLDASEQGNVKFTTMSYI